ncbi:MAG: hypothetical protein HY047_12900, partial [Acidobacteria bacterium]|nr:hypothetical protein [Acidobacteriota bacterium]
MLLRAGVFLITLSGLILEIGLTRIYSATIWYHFAFVVISMALLGWGLGGLAVHLLKRAWPPSIEKAAAFALLYAAAIPACLWILVRYPFQIDRLPLYFLAPLMPFFLGGMALSIVFDLHRAIAGSLYFADLLGASLGAVLVTVLLQTMGGEASLLVAAAAPMCAAACLAPRLRPLAVAGALVMATAAVSNASTGLFHVIPGTIKAMRRQMEEHADARVAQTGWNAYSRIDAVEGLGPPFLARLYIDSDAWTSILPWDGRLDGLHELRDSYRALPFRLTPRGETLVIGPGGGSDVLAALASGSRKVTAVELNPLMIQFVRHYGPQAGDIYNRPEVEIVYSEGRNFISRTDRKFDTIFLGFVDSWASVASGGLSLSENYLYTTQAFRAYYDHLSDDGVLVILRWDMDIPRLISNSVALLGADEAATRAVVLKEKRSSASDPSQMLFMLRKRPFTDAETAEMVNGWTMANPFIVPGRPAPAPYGDLLSGKKSMAMYEAESAKLVGPVFD